MTDTALYNEIEPFAAEWLENLIAAGRIAPGVVDRRSIEDLDPDYVRRFRQVHLFAGIGIWSGALRGAGWPDDRRILTGSCPCQPFSAAGQGNGFADERHLWPAMFHLVTQCGFDVVVGEQVASKVGLAWLDLVQSDLEGAGYAVGAVDMAASGFGAPHIRQRLYWVAVGVGHGDGPQGRIPWGPGAQRQALDGPAGRDGSTGGERLADAGRSDDERIGGPGDARSEAGTAQGETQQRERGGLADRAGGASGLVADTMRGGAGPVAGDGDGRSGERGPETGVGPDGERGLASVGSGGPERPGPVNGGWAAADWLHCRDGRWRPVEPGTFPLAHALPRSMGTMGAGLAGMAALAGADKSSLAAAKRFRTGTLRGFGNAIVRAEAQAFCQTVLEVVG